MILAHTITFAEMLKSREAVLTQAGNMIGGPDRKADDERTKWHLWQKAVQAAAAKPGIVPVNVMQYFQATKHLTKPPQAGDQNIVMNGPIDSSLIVNPAKLANPPRFTWSYTSMNEFLTCPAQWAAKRYYKTLVEGESEAMRVGNMIHDTAENYGKKLIGVKYKESSIHPQYLHMIQKYVDALVASGAQLWFEMEMCFTKQLKPCGWRDWDTVWVRGKGDVLARKGSRLSILDWKTGKFKEDFLQLKLFAVMAALTPGFEDIQEFDPKFIFTKEVAPNNILRLKKPILRSELKPVLTDILAVVRRMEDAWESENFPAKKNGLCHNWCANKICPHCGG